jgi:transposase
MLISQGLQKQVWVFMRSIDMRMSYDGLYGLMKSFHSNPLSGDLFLFLSKDRKKAKAMHWDGSGLVILMKRIERGRFADILARGTMSMSEVSLFFEGAACVRQRLSPPDQTRRYDS